MKTSAIAVVVLGIFGLVLLIILRTHDPMLALMSILPATIITFGAASL